MNFARDEGAGATVSASEECEPTYGADFDFDEEQQERAARGTNRHVAVPRTSWWVGVRAEDFAAIALREAARMRLEAAKHWIERSTSKPKAKQPNGWPKWNSPGERELPRDRVGWEARREHYDVVWDGEIDRRRSLVGWWPRWRLQTQRPEDQWINSIDRRVLRRRLPVRSQAILARRLRGETQKEIAADMGLSQPTVSRWLQETGAPVQDVLLMPSDRKYARRKRRPIQDVDDAERERQEREYQAPRPEDSSVMKYEQYREYLRSPRLSPEEERELVSRWKRGDEEAREELIKRHLRLVVDRAGHYVRPGVPLDELIREGELALWEALRRFDPNHSSSARFATYAYPWVDGAMRRYAKKVGRWDGPKWSKRQATAIARDYYEE